MLTIPTTRRDTEAMHLLEREAQLLFVGEYAAQARHGEGRLVLFAGEAGEAAALGLGRVS